MLFQVMVVGILQSSRMFEDICWHGKRFKMCCQMKKQLTISFKDYVKCIVYLASIHIHIFIKKEKETMCQQNGNQSLGGRIIANFPFFFLSCFFLPSLPSSLLPLYSFLSFFLSIFLSIRKLKLFLFDF